MAAAVGTIQGAFTAGQTEHSGIQWVGPGDLVGKVGAAHGPGAFEFFFQGFHGRSITKNLRILKVQRT